MQAGSIMFLHHKAQAFRGSFVVVSGRLWGLRKISFLLIFFHPPHTSLHLLSYKFFPITAKLIPCTKGLSYLTSLIFVHSLSASRARLAMILLWYLYPAIKINKAKKTGIIPKR